MKRRKKPWWVRVRKRIGSGIANGWDWLTYHLNLVISNLWKGFVFGFKLLGKWWQSRSLRYLVQSVPAMAGVITLIIFVVYYKNSTQSSIPGRYRLLGESALDKKDYKTALVAYQRLILLPSGDNSHNRFKLAQAYFGLGDKERSQLLLTSAAPVGTLGEPQAHFVRAMQLLNNPKRTPQDLREVEIHLLFVLQGEPNNLGAHAMLGQYYLGTKQREKAKEHLIVASESNPELLLLLSRLYEAEKNEVMTKEYAQRAQEFFRRKSKENVEDHVSRLAWGHSLVLLKEYSRAESVFAQGLRITGDPLYRKALAGTLARWSESRKTDPVNQLKILERGLAVDSKNPDLLRQLVTLANSGEKNKAKEVLQNMLAAGNTSAYLHFFLGVHAAQDKKIKVAQVHFELARKKNPNMPELANNMAWLILQDDKGDYKYALELVNFALEKKPNFASFRDTRGQIYVKLKEWNKALEDLQMSLPTHTKNADTHKALAQVYRQLGVTEMADRHQKLAQKFKK